MYLLIISYSYRKWHFYRWLMMICPSKIVIFHSFAKTPEDLPLISRIRCRPVEVGVLKPNYRHIAKPMDFRQLRTPKKSKIHQLIPLFSWWRKFNHNEFLVVTIFTIHFLIQSMSDHDSAFLLVSMVHWTYDWYYINMYVCTIPRNIFLIPTTMIHPRMILT